MTLTELRYIVAVAQKNHFGKAAQACFVSQPTLSIAIKKLEQELEVKLFERSSKNEIRVTEIGQQIVDQAKVVLQEAQVLQEISEQGKDPLSGQFKLGVIYTIGPYLLPHLIPELRRTAPRLKLIIFENFTANLSTMLKQGELDAIVISYPYDEPGIETESLYDEPFVVALPKTHEWANRESINPGDLSQADLMLLGPGHCFREQVVEACPGCLLGNSELTRTLEGGSLETIRHMVAAGTGITVLPQSSLNPGSGEDPLVATRPFTNPSPNRRVALAWRKQYPRIGAINAIKDTIRNCQLEGVDMLKQSA